MLVRLPSAIKAWRTCSKQFGDVLLPTSITSRVNDSGLHLADELFPDRMMTPLPNRCSKLFRLFLRPSQVFHRVERIERRRAKIGRVLPAPLSDRIQFPRRQARLGLGRFYEHHRDRCRQRGELGFLHGECCGLFSPPDLSR